ncbi:MAG: Gfo/Idh/MocA family oxidoreductase [Deltaproteobacteria bacterium]|nr:Gfo/Idh/MocA family oxidoreductase [Deltaproteobacteria bacterium]
MSKIRLGVIGIGFGQHVHVPAFRTDPRCEVAALGASDLKRAAAVADRLGIPRAFGDWRQLLADPDLDAVSLAVPPAIQSEIAVAALEAGKAVFAEKPLAASVTAASRMAAAARTSRQANLVNYEFMDIGLWQQAKAILDQGGLGELRQVAVAWNVEIYAIRHGLTSWKTARRAGGGALYGFASHALYYLEQFLGPIGSLTARLFNPLGDVELGDTAACLCLETAAGVPVSLTVSSHAFLGSGHRLEFYGSQGTMVLNNPTSDYVTGFQLFHGTRESGRLIAVPDEPGKSETHVDGRIDVVAKMAHKFLTWMETGVPCHPSFQDGLRVQKLLHAAETSHRSRTWVEVGPGATDNNESGI